MKAYGITNIGKVRNINQDTFKTAALSENSGLVIVCDGMGGPGGGQIASSIAADIILKSIKQDFNDLLPESKIKELIFSSVRAANTEVFKESMKSAELVGMGTTLVLALYVEDRVYVANIGDSRAYLFKDGIVSQITKDHSIVQDMLDSGKISKFEAKNHPQKNIITRALGVDITCEPDFFSIKADKKDIFMLCSDGLTNHIDETELALELSICDKPKEILGKLVEMANERGGSDNITAVIICSGGDAR